MLQKPRPLLLLLMAFTISSCAKINEEEQRDYYIHNSRIEGRRVDNPYSLRVMRAALASLLSTKTETNPNDVEALEPTDYYVRISAMDTTAIAILDSLNLELFDYPLDCEFPDDTEYCFDPSQPLTSDSDWYYTAVPVEYVVDEVPYEEVLEAEENDEQIDVEIGFDESYTCHCNLLDECYVPEHAANTKSGFGLPVPPEDLEAMAYKLVGAEQDWCITKSPSSSTPSGHIYLQQGSNPAATSPVKGVKVRVQKFLRWRTVYTDANGHFQVSDSFNKPNISIIYSNDKDFIIWGNWLFLAPATYTVTSCTTANSFSKTFDHGDNSYSPWSWSVVNNAAYDYYENCVNGDFAGVSLPPSNMKLWCLNLSLGGNGIEVGGGAPMIKHLYAAHVFTSGSALNVYLTGIGWGTILSSVVAAIVHIMGPDIMLPTHNKTYRYLYATTFHELSHASHFSSIGEWNYGKLIWYEMTHPGDSLHYYGTGGTGTEGEGYCEVSESYAYSIENYVNSQFLGLDDYPQGVSSHYFFNKYVEVLSDILIGEVLYPWQVFRCLGANISSMDDLLQNLCDSYPNKEGEIISIMSSYDL